MKQFILYILFAIAIITISCEDNSCNYQKKDTTKFIGEYQITEISYVEFFKYRDTINYILKIQETNQCGYDLEIMFNEGRLPDRLGANIIDDYSIKFDSVIKGDTNWESWFISGSEITLNPNNDSIKIKYNAKPPVNEGVAQCKGYGTKIKK